jgi:hypothetical protein
MTDHREDDWLRYKELVLSELERLRGEIKTTETELLSAMEKLADNQSKMSVDIIKLKTQATMWGLGAGGFISAIIAFFNDFFIRS